MKIKVGNVSKLFAFIQEGTLRYHCPDIES